MRYFKIGNYDFSDYVNKLEIKDKANYTAQTNAAGDTVVDYINRKRQITVGIIPLNAEIMEDLLTEIAYFNVEISFLNPKTRKLEERVNCIIPDSAVSYYTIRADKTSFNAVTLTFTEL